MQILRFFYIIIILIYGCNPTNEDIQQESQKIIKQLIEQMTIIHNYGELQKSAPQLKKSFNKLVDIIIEARKLEIKDAKFEIKNHHLSDLLRYQVERIYRIDGGKEIIEEMQRDALHKLNAFEKKQNINN